MNEYSEKKFISRDKMFSLSNNFSKVIEIDLNKEDSNSKEQVIYDLVNSVTIKQTKISFEAITLSLFKDDLINNDLCLLESATSEFVENLLLNNYADDKNNVLCLVSHIYAKEDSKQPFLLIVCTQGEALLFRNELNRKIDTINSKLEIKPKVPDLYCNITGDNDFVMSFVN